jgi:hypothetical protein
MFTLLDALDESKEISMNPYFIISYNALPSHLSFRAPMKETKEKMAEVVAIFDFKKFKLKEVYKNWSTEDDKDSDSSNDYPYQYLFKSEEKHLLFYIILSYNTLTVDTYYNAADLELEQEVISFNLLMREKFGTDQAPSFKVLTYESDRFKTEYVKSEFEMVKLEELYNDDFLEINSIIEKSLNKKKSGLILLHGAPGTGKTSYVKNLISKFKDETFIFIQNEFVKDLLRPDFISFLLKNQDSILVIEDAEKVITTRESISENSVVSNILQLTDGLFSDYLNIKIICTFNTNIQRVDKALLRKGRLIANYEFKPLSVEKSNKLLKALGHEIIKSDMTLADIFNIREKSFDSAGDKKKIGFY